MPSNVAPLVVVHGASFWIRWIQQALQGCLLSVASESKNCIQIRMVHEETSEKNDVSITNRNKFTNLSGQKKHLKCASTSNEKKCLQLCMIDIYLDLTRKTMDPSQVALVVSAPKTRRVHLLWSNREAVLRKNLPRSPGGFGGGIAEVDKLTIHGSLRWSHWICFRIGRRFIIWVSIWFGVLERNNFNMFVELSSLDSCELV